MLLKIHRFDYDRQMHASVGLLYVVWFRLAGAVNALIWANDMSRFRAIIMLNSRATVGIVIYRCYY